MDFIADYILIACFSHSDEIDNTVIKSNKNFLGGFVVGDADGLLGVSFGPHLHKFGGLEIALPGLDAADFHKLPSFVLPGQFGVGHFSVDLIDGAGIGGGDEDDVVFLDEVVVPDALGLPLDGVVDVQFGRVHHHL